MQFYKIVSRKLFSKVFVTMCWKQHVNIPAMPLSSNVHCSLTFKGSNFPYCQNNSPSTLQPSLQKVCNMEFKGEDFRARMLEIVMKIRSVNTYNMFRLVPWT